MDESFVVLSNTLMTMLTSPWPAHDLMVAGSASFGTGAGGVVIVVMQQTTSLLRCIICFCSFFSLGLSVVFVFKFLLVDLYCACC